MDKKKSSHQGRIFEAILKELCETLSCDAAAWDRDGNSFGGPVSALLSGDRLAITAADQLMGYLWYSGPRSKAMDAVVTKYAEGAYLRLWEQEMTQKHGQAVRYFIQEWLFSRAPEEEEAFYMRGKLLGIDTRLPYTLALLMVDRECRDIQDESRKELLYRTVMSEIGNNPANLCILLDERFLIFLNESSHQAAKEKAEGIKQRLEGNFYLTIYGGISARSEHCGDLGRCYQNAKTACDTARQIMSAELIDYDALTIDFVIQSIPRQIQRDFTNKVFLNLRGKDFKEWLATLTVLFDCNGSINQAAEQLFMHKNTLQYRINKIWEETGYNPRNTKEAFVLYLALMLKQEE